MKTSNTAAKSGAGHAQETAPAAFLRLFYPFHYVVGAAMEQTLQGETLGHHEAVILWMIHSEAQDGESLPRKEIERLICAWYELGSPAVTKTLKRMAERPEPLISVTDSAHSGREKLIRLTEFGRVEIGHMMDRAAKKIEQIIEGWSETEIGGGLHFLHQVVERIENLKK